MTVEEANPAGDGAVDITSDKTGGVLKKIIKEGTGTEVPAPNNEVTVHYTGTLLNGKKFDSSKDRSEPFKFRLGTGSVIKAWDIGVATMKRGEVALLTCRADYAYGEQGSGTIPPNATLIFEVECIDWKGEDLSPKSNEGIVRTILSKGDGYRSPQDGNLVDVHIVGKYEGRVFEDRSVSFPLGEGSEEGVIDGVEVALYKFRKGEKSRLKIKPAYAFKDVGNEQFNIPPNATVEYEVELKNFEKVEQDKWTMDWKGQIEQAKFYKEKGGKYFKENKLTLATKMYNRMLEFLKSENDGDSEEDNLLRAEEKALALAAHLNLALCYLKSGENTLALDHCDKALGLDKDNEKGLFRRGQALMNAGEPEQAKADFEAVVRLAPDNKAAAKSIIICTNQLKEQRKREKQIYANMFEKFAQKDREEQLWRYGWWDGKHVTTPEALKDPAVEEAEQEQEREKIKSKKLFLEAVKKRKEEMAAKAQENAEEKTEENAAEGTTVEVDPFLNESINNTVDGSKVDAESVEVTGESEAAISESKPSEPPIDDTKPSLSS